MASYLTAPYDYLTQQGVIVADTADIRSQVEAEYIAAFGTDLNLDPTTPQGVLITAETLARTKQVRSNADLANQINPNIAGGGFLDAICALTGIQRRAASPSYLTDVDLTGVPGAIINSGSRAKTVDGDIFRLVTTVQLDGSGEGVGDFQAEENGPIACDVGDLNSIVDNVLGWETVSNPAAAVLGKSTQSDAELRAYRRRTLAKQGTSQSQAIMAAIAAVEGVNSLQYRENVTNGTLVIDGVSLVAHSIWACVDGGVDEDVALAILESKSSGSNMNGTTVAVTDPYSGQSYDVKFARPTEVDIWVKVTIKQITPVSNPTTSVQNAVLAWAAGDVTDIPGLQVGVDVSPFEIAGAVLQQVTGIYVQKVEVCDDGFSWQTTEYAIDIDKIGVTDSGKISVVDNT